MSSATEPQPGQPCYEARQAGCTCAWLRGFGVGDYPEEWAERIISYDASCPVHQEK
jgi:hypothetical protein